MAPNPISTTLLAFIQNTIEIKKEGRPGAFPTRVGVRMNSDPFREFPLTPKIIQRELPVVPFVQPPESQPVFISPHVKLAGRREPHSRHPWNENNIGTTH